FWAWASKWRAEQTSGREPNKVGPVTLAQPGPLRVQTRSSVMAVYQDYRGRCWENYFLPGFIHSHLRPNVAVPLGGHQEARQRAREGNLRLIARAHRGRGAEQNSVIYDFDPEHRVYQVLQLMQEVEKRNRDDFYRQDQDPDLPPGL